MPEWTLPAATSSVPRARRLAVDSLDDVPGDVLDAIALVVSELVTNAVRHARTEITVKVARRADRVEIEVTDQGGGQVTLQAPPPSVAHGRGLQLVQTLTRRWGVIPAGSGSGKTVWCTVPL